MTLGLALRDSHPMRTFVGRDLRGFPPVLSQKSLVLEPENLDFERAATFNHLLFAIGAEAPE